ncbi:MAG: Cof-type HAD-IIB family hydrolase [Muribaculaceae bacterium]|nr:Cof-type HAD-IIB family hydrolase [Muribaculaceae bacterium]
MDKTLYVSDLDGTLLGTDSRLSAATVEMLNRSIEAGVMFSVATARTPATVAEIFRDVHLRHPLVLMTGAVIWDPVANRYLMTRFHDEKTVREILALYRRKGFPTFIYTMRDNKIHIYHQGALNDLERRFMEERIGNPFKEFHVGEDGESELPERLDNVLLLFAMQPTAPGHEIFETVRREGWNVSPMFYHDQNGPEFANMEVFPADATKAATVRCLADSLGAERIVAYGDNFNDRPLLRIADEAVAVDNAIPEVKEEVDRIIGPNTEDSVAKDILAAALS